MKYPMINKQPRREVNVPELSGGLNLRDSLTGVRDNQMTDCVNMWYKDGMLRTRPGFVTSNARLNLSGRTSIDEKIKTRFHNEINIFYDGFDCVLATNKRVVTDEDGAVRCNIEFEFQSTDKIFVMPAIVEIEGGDNITYFCAENGGVLYCYISNFSIWKFEYSKKVDLGEDAPRWEKVDNKELYAPKVLVHCLPTNGGTSFTGAQFEGYSLLTDAYQMIYSTYNENDTVHKMRYPLCNIKNYTSYLIKATIVDSNGTHEHSVELMYIQPSGMVQCEKTASSDNRYMHVNLIDFQKPYIFFSDTNIISESKEIILTEQSEFSEDDLTITVIPIEYASAKSKKERTKVFGMTQSMWFGGAANGINGGSRLFLCGNTEDSEKSLIVWSGLNNPLYFSENCYAYVGSKSRAVTTFGRQGQNLIVFKENKIYCTYYAQNTNIDADSLINQNIVDYEANSVYFPIIQINGYIGCDCPDTVQMCRNRLVWANSEGKVYTLCTMSQYNEHTVYDISEMIATRLKEYKERLRTATSADFGGHYVLFLDDCALVADYCCYGYQYVHSYSKSDNANALIPWYYWDFSFLKASGVGDEYKSACIGILNGTLIMRAYFDASIDSKAALVGFAMDVKEYSGVDAVFYNDFNNNLLQLKDSVINCHIASKLFELGNGIYNINVDGVAVKIGSNNGADITVKFITDQGEESTIVKEKREYRTFAAINFVKPKWIRPCIRAVSKFGLELECDGGLVVDGLSIQYRLLGGVK